MNRILFLVDTKSLGEQAEQEFDSYIPDGSQVYISTIQGMYSILKGEELDEKTESIPFAEHITAETKSPKEVVYNEKYPPEFFDCIIVDECHRSIYNIWSQVRTVIRAFKENLFTTLFQHRTEVPKILIFAKSDSHADDIIQIVRDEFGEGNTIYFDVVCKIPKARWV